MRKFENPELKDRYGKTLTVTSAIWDRHSKIEAVPVTPRRMLLTAVWAQPEGKPKGDEQFSRKMTKVLDALEPQEKKGKEKLEISTEILEDIRKWVGPSIIMIFPIDGVALLDQFDEVIDGKAPPDNGHKELTDLEEATKSVEV